MTRTQICCLFLFSTCVAGQSVTRSYNTDGITPTGIAPGTPSGSYAINGFDNVNLFNRKGNISLPLAEIRTRRGAGYTMKLNLDQAWRVKLRSEGCMPGDTVCNQFASAKPDWWAGQEIEYGPGLVAGRFMDSLTTCNGNIVSKHTLTRLTYIDSSTSERTLVDSETKGRAREWSYLNGGSCASRSSVPRGPRFESVDGESMTFVSSSAIPESGRTNPGDPQSSRPTIFPTGTLYDAEGTRYFVDTGKIQKIRDRNGNTVVFTELPNNEGLSIQEATRMVEVRYLATCDVTDTAGTKCDRISLGSGTSDPKIRIYWKQLSTKLSEQGGGLTVKTNQQLFQGGELDWDTAETAITFDPLVVSKVVLPNQRHYTFDYDEYGEVTKAVLPTGAYYTYTRSTRTWRSPSFGLLRQMDARQEFDELGRFRRRTEYSFDGTGANIATLVKDFSHNTRSDFNFNNRRLAKVTRTLYPTPFISLPSDIDFYSDWRDGRESRTDILQLSMFPAGYNPDSIPSSNIAGRTERTWELREARIPRGSYGSPAADYLIGAPFNPRNTIERNWLAGLAQSNTANRSYDSFNNVTFESVQGFDGAQLTSTSRTFVTTVNSLDYTNEPAHIRRLLKEESIGNGATESLSQLEYDIYSSVDNHDLTLGAASASSYEDPLLTQRGNLSRLKQQLPGGGWATTDSKYDVLGNVLKIWQPTDSTEGNLERSTEYTFNGTCNFTYPVASKDPAGRTTSAAYNCRTGQITSLTDVNSQATTYTYADPLDRLTQINGPQGLMSTSIYYDDAPSQLLLRVTKSQNSCGSNNIVNESTSDGFGRGVSQRRFDDAGAVNSKREFDGLGRVIWIGDAYRSTEGHGVELEYDSLGRVVKSRTTADGSENLTGYSGSEVWTRDSAGKWRKTLSDAIGRLVSVTEDPAVSAATSPIAGFSNVNGANLVTNYEYNARNHLTKVTQGSQVRDFEYDSMGRLSVAKNPELGPDGTGVRGETQFAYYSNGGLKSKTEPGTVVTTMTYDVLGRLLSKQYAGSTAATTSATYFCYDGNASGNCAGGPTSTLNALGRVTMAVTDGIQNKVLAYDALGQITQSAVKFGSDPDYVFSYQYNLAGGLAEEQYPSGLRIASCHDGSGQVKSVKNGATQSAWVSAAQYEPSGALKEWTLGNGVVESWSYNNRWQTSGIAAVKGGVTLLGLQIHYCPGEGAACASNNGSVASIRTQHTGFNELRSFGYDSLNRLASATEASGFSQTFSYDRYGNRAVTAGWKQTGNNTPEALSVYQETRNRIAQAPDGVGGTAFQYDSRGNLKTLMNGWAYQFNAENMMVEAKQGSTVKGSYRYDANGKRVERTAGGKTTRFIYDAMGNLAAEYEVGAPAAGGRTTTYLVGDHLGSTLLMVEPNDQVKRFDYAPFGEPLFAGSFGRGAEYGSDPTANAVAQRFTGKERDQETGLDYFGARYLSAAMGRFTSPDAPFADQHTSDPQSWNLYSYSRNSPVQNFDPSGRKCVQTSKGSADDGTGGGCEAAGVDADGNISAQKFTVTDTGQLLTEDKGVVFSVSEDGKRTPVAERGLQDASFELIPMLGVGRSLLGLGSREAGGMAGSIRNVNPTGGKMNCVNCAIATDATLAGRAATALPGSATSIGVLEQQFGGQFVKVSSQQAIESTMQAAGSGARAIVYGERTGGGVGHVFNVVNQNGVVRFLDGQTGGVASFAGYTGLRLLRTN